MLITINKILYDVPEPVAQAMENLKADRDHNYNMAVDLNKRLMEAAKAVRTVKGITSVKRVKGQKQLFK